MPQALTHVHRALPGVAWSHPVGPDLFLRGRDYIRGERPLLHFVHGNGFSGMTYWPLLGRLHDHYDLCLHDTQGHGDSDDGARFPGWNATADRIVEFMTQRRALWGDRPVIGVGHSFGGIVTLLAASRAPELFDGIVLLDPVLFPPLLVPVMAAAYFTGLSQLNPMVMQAKRRGSQWDSRDAAWSYFYQRGIFRGWTDEALTAYIDHALARQPDGSLTLKCPPWMEAQIFASFPRRLWSSVRRLTVPTRILFGTNSYPFVRPSVERAARLNAAIRVHAVPGGHCFMQQDPEAAAQETARSLAQVLEASAAPPPR